MAGLLVKFAQANSNSRVPGIFAVVVIVEATELLKRLQLMVTTLEDPREFWRELSTELGQLYDQQYRSGTGWDGADLIETGRLRRSLTSPGSSENVRQISRTSMFYGTRVPYAAPIKRGAHNMQPRDPARLNGQQLNQRIQATADRSLTGSTRRLGI